MGFAIEDLTASGTERMRINSSGNVGIGTTSPSEKLVVYGTILSTGAGVGNFGGNISFGSNSVAINGNPILGEMNFSTSGATAMTIDNSNNVLVGTTSAAGEGLTIYPAGGGASTPQLLFNRPSSSDSGTSLVFNNGGTTVGSVSYTNTSTSYNTSSDYRLKENVVGLTNALDRVDALKPSRFNFIADPEKTVDGFLAHEVQEVVPEAVTGEKDAVDEEGNPIYQGIDQSKLVPLLVGAIKELKARIAILEEN